MTLQDKINYSIDLIKRSENLALKYSEKGFHLAFSGGKDSIVIYHLAKMAGVKFTAHMQVTTLDPPELMKFIRNNYPDVVLHRPDINFFQLIKKKKALPLRRMRYCCSYLKEQSGAGRVVIIGIRRAESSQRNKRNEIEVSDYKYSNTFDQFNIDKEALITCINGKDKIMLSPILYWTDEDVWNFIKLEKLKYCKLYDEGYKRIGCMFCPMASKKSKALDRKRFPGVEREIKKSIQCLINDNGYMGNYTDDVDEIFNWWLSNESAKVYFEKQKQLKLF